MRDFKLEVFLSEWEFKARYHMTASDMQSMSIRELVQLSGGAEQEDILDCWLGYAETRGKADVREAIADTYESISAADVLCFAGAEEGLYASMRVLLGVDDHAICITPNYQAAETLPLSICATTGVALDWATGWSLDLDALKAAIKPNTKLISINFPNNPTGKIIDRDAYRELIEICRSRGLWLFSDEVYRLLERDSERRLTQAVDAYERGISLNVMSKAYGLPGLRVGWVACRDGDLLARLEHYKHYLSICNASPSERLTVLALSVREKILTRNRRLVTENLANLQLLFDEFPHVFDWHLPDGGCVGYVRYKGDDGVMSFARRILDEEGVLVLPAAIYASDLTETPPDHFRIGFGRANFDAGLAAMRSWLHKNN
jgi:aspartate/methionine/tyrosine aminotransferase